jgi:hypothetical protein
MYLIYQSEYVLVASHTNNIATKSLVIEHILTRFAPKSLIILS